MPRIAHPWACVDGLTHSLMFISWSCGSCIQHFTAMLRFSCPQISITVNVKCHCQWIPANQSPRTTGNIGRSWCKSSSEVWFGPGLDDMVMSRWCHYKSNVDSTAKNRASEFVGATYFTFTRVWTGLFLHDSSVVSFNYLHLLYKSGKHWANTHWIKFPKQQVVGVGFPLYSNLFHYCIAVTWHTKSLWHKHFFFNSSRSTGRDPSMSDGLQKYCR